MPQLFGFDSIPIPGPRAIPFLGLPIRLYKFLDDPLGAILALREHGQVASLVADNPAIVVALGPERVREVLSNPDIFRHDETLFRGPKGSYLDKLRLTIVSVNGDVHKRHRRLMMPAFQRSALEAYAEDVTTVTEHMLSRWPSEGEVRADSLVRELALCIAVKCFYGMDVTQGATGLGHLAAEMVEILTDPFTILTPFDLPGFPYHQAVVKAEALLKKLESLVEEKRRQGPGGRDALSLLVHSVSEDGSRLSDDELLAEASTLFIAGHETIAMTIAWTLFLLERHPPILSRLLDEIEATVDLTPPKPSDFARMPFTERVIRESMRILPSVPTLFMRACAQEVQVGDIRLPPFANVVVSPLVAHHDPNVWPEPRRFNPDRWIELTPASYTYLPYGGGPRTCLGAMFASQALKIVLPMILRRFRFHVMEGADISRLTRANILLFKYGLPMRFEPYHRNLRTPAPIRGDIHQLVELAYPST